MTDANELMRPILAPEDWNVWLKPYRTENIAAWPVSTKVNSPNNDSVECLKVLNSSAKQHGTVSPEISHA